MHPRLRAALAGAVAAAAWVAVEPFDRRLFRNDYSDVAVLGKTFTGGPWWRPLGFGIHLLNGAIFGLVYHEVRSRVRADPERLALAMALAEHLAFFPVGYVVDRRHPARGEPGLAPIFSVAGFGQETLRHGVFGVVLGRLA